jgi:hypothetical protein
LIHLGTTGFVARCSLIAILASACGCGGRYLLEGTRQATAVDRSTVLEAKYVCTGSGAFRVEGATVRELEPKVGMELRKGPQGFMLLTGDIASTVHWQSPKGDHFFAWNSGRTIGAETIIAPDRESALGFVYAVQTGDTEAFTTDEAPDGTLPRVRRSWSRIACARISR